MIGLHKTYKSITTRIGGKFGEWDMYSLFRIFDSVWKPRPLHSQCRGRHDAADSMAHGLAVTVTRTLGKPFTYARHCWGVDSVSEWPERVIESIVVHEESRLPPCFLNEGGRDLASSVTSNPHSEDKQLVT